MGRPKRWTFDALDPFDDSGENPRRVWIEQRQVEFLTKGKLTARFYRLRLVQEVLEDPLAVFEGWQREGYEEGLCYVGRRVTTPPMASTCRHRPERSSWYSSHDLER